MSDLGKPKLSLVPLVGLVRAARVFEAGLKNGRKPGDWKNLSRQEFVDARMRHIIAIDSGDPGEDHEGCVLANTLIIMWFDEFKDLAAVKELWVPARPGAEVLENSDDFPAKVAELSDELNRCPACDSLVDAQGLCPRRASTCPGPKEEEAGPPRCFACTWLLDAKGICQSKLCKNYRVCPTCGWKGSSCVCRKEAPKRSAGDKAKAIATLDPRISKIEIERIVSTKEEEEEYVPAKKCSECGDTLFKDDYCLNHNCSKFCKDIIP